MTIWTARACPLCDGVVVGTTGKEVEGYVAVCLSCRHYGPIRSTRKLARAAWNRTARETEGESK
jgi:hypothetical protein